MCPSRARVGVPAERGDAARVRRGMSLLDGRLTASALLSQASPPVPLASLASLCVVVWGCSLGHCLHAERSRSVIVSLPYPFILVFCLCLSDLPGLPFLNPSPDL